ncbi:MAG: hypothetical protein LBN33_02825 [Desulfovibrio sp.]|jgi:transposase|nr:hypothetical protein [Desulfovibrio sp.]
MKIANQEIRKIAVEAYLSGKANQQQIADILGFHRTAIVRWVREFRYNGKLTPEQRGHMAKAFSHQECERLAELVKSKPDITLVEIKEAFSKNCSLMSVHRELKRLGFRFKKTLKASEQEREDIAEARKDWARVLKTPAERLVFLDESSAKTNMTRLRGRSYKGSRCHDTAPSGHWKTRVLTYI